MLAFAEGARAAIQLMGPALLGADPRQIEQVYARMDGVLYGHAYAKSPIDIACWDLLGQATGLPVSDLLGGTVQRAIPPLPGGRGEPAGGDAGAGRASSGPGLPPLPGEGRQRPLAGRRRARPGLPGRAPGPGGGDRRRQRLLAPARGRPVHRRAGGRADLPGAALPDARRVPGHPPPHRAAR